MNGFQEFGDMLKQYFLFHGESDWESGFRCGSFFAIATFLLLLLLLVLLRMIFFRRHQIRKMTMDAPAGKFEVSISAITDLLSAEISKIAEISLLKARIYPVRGNKCQIVLSINYFPGEESTPVPQLVSKIQEDTLASLSRTFGIESVDSVVIRVSRAKRKKHA